MLLLVLKEANGMWVHKGNSLYHRLKLDSRIGFWLDYWLFLHSEETHPIWNSRPLGLRSLAIAALQSTADHDYTLRTALAQEIHAASRLSSVVVGLPVPPSNLPERDGTWSNDWLRWFEETIRMTEGRSIIPDLVVAIVAALRENDLFTATYLTRRLAAEAAQVEALRSELFILVKRELCDSGSFDDAGFEGMRFMESLVSLLTVERKFDFTVTVRVAPVGVTKTITRKLRPGGALLIEGGDEGLELLTGISVTVEAVGIDQAASLGLEAAKRLLTFA